MFLSDEGPSLETLDFAFCLSAVHQALFDALVWLETCWKVFRRYTQIRRSICTSESLRASTSVSAGFALFRHSSPSFGSRQVRSNSNLSKSRIGRSMMPLQQRSRSLSSLQPWLHSLSLSPTSFDRSETCAHVRLLGPCFKTGRIEPPSGQRPQHVVSVCPIVGESFPQLPRGTPTAPTFRLWLDNHWATRRAKLWVYVKKNSQVIKNRPTEFNTLFAIDEPWWFFYWKYSLIPLAHIFFFVVRKWFKISVCSFLTKKLQNSYLSQQTTRPKFHSLVVPFPFAKLAFPIFFVVFLNYFVYLHQVVLYLGLHASYWNFSW